MAYSCCFVLWGNLDFPDFLQNKFYNINYWNFVVFELFLPVETSSWIIIYSRHIPETYLINTCQDHAGKCHDLSIDTLIDCGTTAQNNCTIKSKFCLIQNQPSKNCPKPKTSPSGKI